MFAIMALTLSFLWLCLGAVLIILDFNNWGDGLGFAFGSIIVLGTFLINLLSIPGHVEDLTTLRTSEKYIAVRERAIKELNVEIERGWQQGTAVFNADTPIATHLATKAKFIDDISMRRDEAITAQRNIEARKLGPSAWVVWLMGDA